MRKYVRIFGFQVVFQTRTKKSLRFLCLMEDISWFPYYVRTVITYLLFLPSNVAFLLSLKKLSVFLQAFPEPFFTNELCTETVFRTSSRYKHLAWRKNRQRTLRGDRLCLNGCKTIHHSVSVPSFRFQTCWKSSAGSWYHLCSPFYVALISLSVVMSCKTQK